MDEREKVRKNIKSPAKNLADQIVKIVEEYRNELTLLEKDNKELKKENKHLVILNHRYNLKNNFLDIRVKNLETQNIRLHHNYAEQLGADKNCYVCFHSLQCEAGQLCCYCQKWICSCCTIWCREPKEEGSMCLNRSCIDCSLKENSVKCAEHNDALPQSRKENLLKYYYTHQYDSLEDYSE